MDEVIIKGITNGVSSVGEERIYATLPIFRIGEEEKVKEDIKSDLPPASNC